MAENDTEGVQVRPFADFLRETNKGLTHEEMSEALRDLIAAVQDTGKKGSLTLTIEVAPLDKDGGDTLTITDKVVLKAPTPPRKATIFYVDEHGNPVRDDPNQLQFETLKGVDEPAAPTTLKQVGS